MKYFINDILNKIQQYSKRLDYKTILENCQWIILSESNDSKIVYIFRPDNQLLISVNGVVSINKWEYLNNNSLLLTISNTPFLYKISFYNENSLILKLDGNEAYIYLINESYFERKILNLEIFLSELALLTDDNNTVSDNLEKESVVELEDLLKLDKNRLSLVLLKQEIEEHFKYKREYLINNQPIIFFCYYKKNITLGDRVYVNDVILPDGKYKLSFLYSVTIKDGIVIA